MAEGFNSDELAALASERELLLQSKRIFEEKLAALHTEETRLHAVADAPADASLATPSQSALMLQSLTPARAVEPACQAAPAAPSASPLGTPGVQELLLGTLGADSPWLAAGPAQ